MKSRLFSPVLVDFNITKRCNLKCSFCYASACNNISDEMNIDTIDKCFKEFNDLNIHIVRISGGEPFVRSDILDILRLTEKYNFTVCMNTNGTLITKDDIDILNKSKLVSMAISLDGYNSELHDKVRGVKGSFDKTINTIKNLVDKANFEICTTYTITKKNCCIEHIKEAIELNISLGINKISFQLTSPVGRAAENLDYTPTYDQWKEVFLWLTNYKLNNNEKISIQVNPTNEADVFWEFYLPLRESNKLMYLDEVWGQNIDDSKDEEYVSCVAGILTITIDANGDIYPCELMMSYPELKVGNIQNDNLKYIWDNSKLIENLANLKMKNLKGNCSNCELKFCGGGCRAVSYALGGDIDFDDERCPLSSKEVCKC